MQTVELRCAECGRLGNGERGWQAHFVPADEGPEDELVVHCPKCAESEFGGHEARDTA